VNTYRNTAKKNRTAVVRLVMQQ